MGWVGLFIIAVGVIAGIIAVAGRKKIREEGGDPGIAGLVSGVALFIGIALTAWHCYTPIDAGKVGIEYGPSGSIVGQMNGGGFIAPWQSVKQLDTRVQKAEYDGLDVFSKETIEGKADVTVNYHVNPQDAQRLIRTVGFNYETTLIHSRVQNDVKDATVKYAAVDLAPHREDIRKAVATHLDAELAVYSIHVDAVQVNNIALPASITGPLAARQAAVINAQAAQNKVKQVQAEAEQKVAEAEGTAKANRAIADSVSHDPGYIDYIKAQAMLKLAENPNTKIIPSSVFFSDQVPSSSSSATPGG